ncbi:hypothetical protein ACHAXS_001986 [Conticribra weissflogii]
MNKDGFFDYFRAIEFYPGCIITHKNNRNSSTGALSQKGACLKSATNNISDQNLPSTDAHHGSNNGLNLKTRKRSATIERAGSRDKKRSPNNDDPEETNGEVTPHDANVIHHRTEATSLNDVLHHENRENVKFLPSSLLASVEIASRSVVNSVAGFHANGKIDDGTVMGIGFFVGYQEGCSHVRHQYEDPIKRQFLMP